MRHLLFALCAAVLFLVGCTNAPPPDDFGALPEFTLTERSGKTVQLADLRGKVWVASFTFTRCAGACGQIQETMARLQGDLAGERGFLQVSISVDPEHDTSELQREYAKSRGAQEERWWFLTGKRDQIYPLIQQGFKLTVYQTEGPARKPGFEVEHTPKVAVVDRRGHVRGYFDGRQMDDTGAPINEYPALKQRIQSLLNNEGSMTADDLAGFNAILNAVACLLLLAGYFAIRARKETLHKACMLTALMVSAVFLASYLYLHLVIKQGQPTYFSERHPDAAVWLSQLYYVILGTHIILAALTLPLALTTAYLGLRDRRARHTRLARWTFPIWLYVSVTGVIVYWMLYRL